MGIDRRHHSVEPPPLGPILVQKQERGESKRPPTFRPSQAKRFPSSPLLQTQWDKNRPDGSGGRETHLPGSPVGEGSPTRRKRRGDQQEIQMALKTLLSKSPLNELLIPINDLIVLVSQETHERIFSLFSLVALIDKDLNKIKTSFLCAEPALPEVVSENHREFLSFYQTYEKNKKILLSELSDLKNTSKEQKKVASDIVDLKSDVKTWTLQTENLANKILPISLVDIERRVKKCSFLTEEISKKNTKKL